MKSTEQIVTKLLVGTSTAGHLYPVAKGILAITISDGSPDAVLNDLYTLVITGNAGNENLGKASATKVPSVAAAVAGSENTGGATVAASITGTWCSETITLTCIKAGASGVALFSVKGSKSGNLNYIKSADTIVATDISTDGMLVGTAYAVLYEPISTNDNLVCVFKNVAGTITEAKTTITVYDGYGAVFSGLSATNNIIISYESRAAG